MKHFIILLFALSLAASVRASYFGTVAFNAASSSAFGDLVTAENTPLLQLDFIYGANTQLGTLSATGAASAATTSSGRLALTSGTANSGHGTYVSTRPAKYRQGQGITARYTTVFTSGVAKNTQIVGMGNATDGYFVGYNGTSFGICHRFNGSDTWTAQASWVGDGAGFTIDPTKGNVWMIRYPFLGYGAIHFFVLSPGGEWRRIHTIQYPTLYVGSVGVFLNGQRGFLGPTYGYSNRKTSITTETNIFTLRNATTYNGITNRSLVRIKSVSVGWDNNSATCLLNVSKNVTLGGTTTFSTINGTTADDGVTITAGNSVTSYNTAATISGGTIQFNGAVGANGSFTFDLTPFDIFIEPAGAMTFSVVGDASGAARVAVNWVEDI
jgi:hypothetical protein